MNKTNAFACKPCFYAKSCFAQKVCYQQTPCFTQKPCSCWATARAVCNLQDSSFHGGRRNTPKAVKYTSGTHQFWTCCSSKTDLVSRPWKGPAVNKHLGVCLVGLVAIVTLHDEIITIFASRSLTLVVFCWAFTPFVKPFAALQGVRASVQAKLCPRIRTECRRLDAATWQNAMVRYEYGMNQFFFVFAGPHLPLKLRFDLRFL